MPMVRHKRVREMGKERTEIFHAGTWTRRLAVVRRRTSKEEEKTVIDDSPISLPRAIIMMS
jgi:hypothetical protein